MKKAIFINITKIYYFYEKNNFINEHDEDSSFHKELNTRSIKFTEIKKKQQRPEVLKNKINEARFFLIHM